MRRTLGNDASTETALSNARFDQRNGRVVRNHRAESSRRSRPRRFFERRREKAIGKFCEQFDCAFESQLSEQTTHLVMGGAKVDANLTLKKKSAKFYDAIVKDAGSPPPSGFARR